MTSKKTPLERFQEQTDHIEQFLDALPTVTIALVNTLNQVEVVELALPSAKMNFGKSQVDIADELQYINEVRNYIRNAEKAIKDAQLRFVTRQALVMLVTALEVYLEDAFKDALIQTLRRKKGSQVKPEVMADKLASRYNFQNWEQVKDAFAKEFRIDLTRSGIPESDIEIILQDRHIIVHNLGIRDKQYQKKTHCPTKLIGQELDVTEAHVRDALQKVESLVNYVDAELQKV